jgi:uncharacterized protein YcbK (DUF882 family)
MTDKTPLARRHLLRRASHLAALAASSLALPWPSGPARAAAGGERRLALVHTHTGERLALAFAIGAEIIPDALGALDHFLRDHYSGTVGRIDPQLFDQLHRLQAVLGRAGPYEIISGYRSAATNQRLRERGGGVARHSLHLEGRAIDVRLPGVATTELRDAALSLRAGGVGTYVQQSFVHLDTGRVRSW